MLREAQGDVGDSIPMNHLEQENESSVNWQRHRVSLTSHILIGPVRYASGGRGLLFHLTPIFLWQRLAVVSLILRCFHWPCRELLSCFGPAAAIRSVDGFLAIEVWLNKPTRGKTRS